MKWNGETITESKKLPSGWRDRENKYFPGAQELGPPGGSWCHGELAQWEVDRRRRACHLEVGAIDAIWDSSIRLLSPSIL